MSRCPFKHAKRSGSPPSNPVKKPSGNVYCFVAAKSPLTIAARSDSSIIFKGKLSSLKELLKKISLSYHHLCCHRRVVCRCVLPSSCVAIVVCCHRRVVCSRQTDIQVRYFNLLGYNAFVFSVHHCQRRIHPPRPRAPPTFTAHIITNRNPPIVNLLCRANARLVQHSLICKKQPYEMWWEYLPNVDARILDLQHLVEAIVSNNLRWSKSRHLQRGNCMS
jgi:hypothetical protein